MTDIRTLVRLMCLAAAGRAGLSTGPCSGLGPSERPRGVQSQMAKPISCLAYLSTAVGCLASNSPSAAALLVQLCTQVRGGGCFHCGLFFLFRRNSDLRSKEAASLLSGQTGGGEKPLGPGRRRAFVLMRADCA